MATLGFIISYLLEDYDLVNKDLKIYSYKEQDYVVNGYMKQICKTG